MELGSGLGDYAQRWLDLGVPEITVTEADPVRLAGLHERFAGGAGCTSRPWTWPGRSRPTTRRS